LKGNKIKSSSSLKKKTYFPSSCYSSGGGEAVELYSPEDVNFCLKSDDAYNLLTVSLEASALSMNKNYQKEKLSVYKNHSKKLIFILSEVI